jgi:hypothetical protein
MDGSYPELVDIFHLKFAVQTSLYRYVERVCENSITLRVITEYYKDLKFE